MSKSFLPKIRKLKCVSFCEDDFKSKSLNSFRQQYKIKLGGVKGAGTDETFQFSIKFEASDDVLLGIYEESQILLSTLDFDKD